MAEDPWGRDEPPATTPTAPLPPRLADLAALTGRRPYSGPWDFPAPGELPEVQHLAADGWRPLEPAPLYSCLPAVWPAECRCWVPDRLPKVGDGFDGHGQWLEPWPAMVYESAREDAIQDAADCGLPAPPEGRLGLLRSPWPSVGLEVVLDVLMDRAAERYEEVATPEITEAAREVLAWDEQRLWEWWTGPVADAARAWRDRGRTGEDVAALVVAALGPQEVAAVPELTEAQLLAWTHAVWRRGAEAVELIRRWLALGLPVDPPPDPTHTLEQVEPAEAARWLAADFDLAEIGTVHGVDLDLALDDAAAWRDHGFATDEVARLLDADRTLTPAEATAFDAAGIPPAERVRWVEDGFDARAARAWTDLGILPGEARVWRSVGKGPLDAAGAGPLPPDVEVGWFAYGGDRHQRRYGVTDPPGTRGRSAQE